MLQDQNASKTSSVELEPGVSGSGPENGKKKEANGCQPPVHPSGNSTGAGLHEILGLGWGDSLDDDTEGVFHILCLQPKLATAVHVSIFSQPLPRKS